MGKSSLTIILAATALLAGCSDTPETTSRKPEEAALEPLTGQSALWKMYQSARTWAPDVQVHTMSSVPQEGAAAPGKASAWQATFGSVAKGRMRLYTYSTEEAEGNLHKGVFAGLEEAMPGVGPESLFPPAHVKVDSDAAYKTAALRAAPDAPKKKGAAAGGILCLLEKTKERANPVWRIVWGETVAAADVSVYVDATTGDYLKTMH